MSPGDGAGERTAQDTLRPVGRQPPAAPAAKFAFVYLASQSPRRRQLLDQIGVRHELLLPGPEEDAEALEAERSGESPLHYVERVTRAKLAAARARRIARDLPAAPILCADTTVALRRRILGKPRDAVDAAATLRLLAGRTHRVITAVAVGVDANEDLRDQRIECPLRRDRRGRHRALRGQRRAVRQGRRVRDSERRGGLDRARRRQLLRYHGFAPVRDRATAATRRRRLPGDSPDPHRCMPGRGSDRLM
jgi:hypothetical protein